MSGADSSPCTRRSFTLKELFALILILSVLFALVIPAIQSSRVGYFRTACMNNLKQIGLAVQMYESAYNCLPPAGFGIDEASLQSRLKQGLAPLEIVDGQSVFTHLLRTIEGGKIVANYDWDRTYDDPQVKACTLVGYKNATWNQQTAKQGIPTFRCPANPFLNVRDPAGYGITDYMPITYTDIDPKPVGNNNLVGLRNRQTTATGCFTRTGMRLSEMCDGTSNTIMIAESAGRLPETSRPFMCGQLADSLCNMSTGQTNANTKNGVAPTDTCTKTGRRAFWRWAEPTCAGGISGQRNYGVSNQYFHFVNGNKDPMYGGTTAELAVASCLAPPDEGTTAKCLWTWTNCGPNDEIFGWHNGGAFVVMADGAVRMCYLVTPAEEVELPEEAVY